MKKDDYIKHVVSATADGANVNFGVVNGVLTQLKAEREWLVIVHCINHRVELGIKGAFEKNPIFDEIE